MAHRSQQSLDVVAKVITQVILVVLSVFAVLPFLWMITTALKPDDQTLKNPPVLIPHPVLFENFPKAFAFNADKLGFVPFQVYGLNTLMLVVLTVSGVVVSNALVGYSFARLRWPGRDLIFAITLATMMVPFPVLMVPQFAMFKAFHWIGTYRPLWVPAWFAGAFNIFLLRQFFRSIPFELSEAAKLDGCSEWRTFIDVIIPLAKPALAVVALFALMGTWNDFLGPIVYLQDQKQFTLAVGLNFYKSQAGGTSMNLLMAASTMVILPIVILYFFTQKLFIQGIAATGLKG